MKIVVLAGGFSPERDVSLSSGSLIANALMDRGHEVALLDLFYGTEEQPPWQGLFHRREEGKQFSYTIPEDAPDLEMLWKESSNGRSMVGTQVVEVCRSADLVFLALHGAMGENGQIQALFDAYGIPYTGTGYIGSLLAMDKDLSKTLFCHADILTPKWEKFSFLWTLCRPTMLVILVLSSHVAAVPALVLVLWKMNRNGSRHFLKLGNMGKMSLRKNTLPEGSSLSVFWMGKRYPRSRLSRNKGFMTTPISTRLV